MKKQQGKRKKISSIRICRIWIACRVPPCKSHENSIDLLRLGWQVLERQKVAQRNIDWVSLEMEAQHVRIKCLAQEWRRLQTEKSRRGAAQGWCTLGVPIQTPAENVRRLIQAWLYGHFVRKDRRTHDMFRHERIQQPCIVSHRIVLHRLCRRRSLHPGFYGLSTRLCITCDARTK